MEIDYINGPKTDAIFGMSRYQSEVHKRIKEVDFNIIEYESFTKILEKKYRSMFPVKNNNSSNKVTNNSLKNRMVKNIIKSANNISSSIDRYRYVNVLKKQINKENVKHVTYQDLGYLFNSIELEKSIITCYDLIPWVYEKNRSSFWKNNINGLKKASKIITISEFSKSEIIKYLNYPPENIEIVYPAVNHELYRKLDGKDIRQKLNITEDYKIVLYVGSEEPRQNLDLLINAFSKLKKSLNHVKLIKIGNPHLYGAREKLLKQINDLGLQKDIIFLDFVDESELPLWYNTADILVYPCAYAGFGLPPLEAMACGTPVITSNTTSLPEVVGNAGIMLDPQNIEKLSAKIYEVLTNIDLRNDMSVNGIKRAEKFNWNNAASQTLNIYNEMSR